MFKHAAWARQEAQHGKKQRDNSPSAITRKETWAQKIAANASKTDSDSPSIPNYSMWNEDGRGFSQNLYHFREKSKMDATFWKVCDVKSGSTLDPIGRHHLDRENLESNLRSVTRPLVGFGFRILSKWRMSLRVLATRKRIESGLSLVGNHRMNSTRPQPLAPITVLFLLWTVEPCRVFHRTFQMFNRQNRTTKPPSEINSSDEFSRT